MLTNASEPISYKCPIPFQKLIIQDLAFTLNGLNFDQQIIANFQELESSFSKMKIGLGRYFDAIAIWLGVTSGMI